MPEPGGELLTNAASGIVGSHQIILQSLDSWRSYKHADGTNEDLFFGSERFTGTEPKWEQVPIIFGKRHPKTPYSKDPEKALQEAEGQVVGNLSEVVIPQTGTKTVRATTNFTDSKVEKLHELGKLAISSGFLSGSSDGHLTGCSGGLVEPDHVLVFVPDKQHRPQDGAALFLNSTMPDETPGEDKALISKLVEVLRSLTGKTNDPTVQQSDSMEVYGINDPGSTPSMYYRKNFTLMQNMEERVSTLEKELGTAKTELSAKDELIKNMTAELDGFKQAEEQRKAAELENKWSLVKNSIAPGLTATAELETAARSEWQADPTSFLIKNAVGKAPETKPDGIQFVKNASSDEDAEYLKFLRGEV